MRRLLHRALVCALLCLLLGSGPALAADSHHHAHHATTHSTTTLATHSSSIAISASGKATTKDGLQILNDCSNHGQLTHDYPLSWLRKALSMLSADTAEYSDCSTVLRQAILHKTKGGSGGSSGSGTTTIVIIVVVVLVILAALLGTLAVRRRRRSP